MYIRSIIWKHVKNTAAVGLLGVIIFFGWLTFTGGLDPTFSALHLLRKPEVPAISESPRHAQPDLSAFPAQLDDLVVAAHYDDEALAEGGLLASEIKSGKSVGVVIVTFSEGQARDQRTWYGLTRHYRWLEWYYINQLRLSPQDRTAYAGQREGETDSALDVIGVPRQNRIYLRYPNLAIGELMREPDELMQGTFTDPVSHQVETYTGADLKATLRSIMARSKPKRVLTHFTDDTNADHRDIGRLLLDEIVPSGPGAPIVWSFLVHWSTQDGGWVPSLYADEGKWLRARPAEFYQVPEGSPQLFALNRQTMTVPWSGDIVTWKARLIKHYVSQVNFDQWMLPHFAKQNEIFWDQREKTLIDVRFGEKK